MKENVVIVNNDFKENLKKYKNFNLLQGIILIIIGITGLFFDSKILLRLAVYVFPILVLSNVVKTVMNALSIRKTDVKNFWIMLVQAVLLFVGAVYVIIKPFDTLQYLVIGIGLLFIINSVVNFIATKGSITPVATTIIGVLCLIFPNQIIDIFYTIILVIILIIGVFKLSAATFINKIK